MYKMKIFRDKKEICVISDYHILNKVIDDLDTCYAYPKYLNELMSHDKYVSNYVYTLDKLEEFKKKKEKDILECKEDITNHYEYLKAYYNGGYYNNNKEEKLKEEIIDLKNCLNEDIIDSDASQLRDINKILNHIEFILKYLYKVDTEEYEWNKQVYIVVEEYN